MKKVWCNDCKVWCTATVRYGSNYFITISIKAQIQDILSKIGRFISFLQQGLRDLRDVGDGERMQRLAGVTGTNRFLSLLFSTDGSPAINSGNKSMRPITAFINELAPRNPIRLALSGRNLVQKLNTIERRHSQEE